MSALRWADIADAADGDGILVTVRHSKTNQEGETRDVRFVKDGVARALRRLRAAANLAPEDQVVPLSPQMVGLRLSLGLDAAHTPPGARARKVPVDFHSDPTPLATVPHARTRLSRSIHPFAAGHIPLPPRVFGL